MRLLNTKKTRIIEVYGTDVPPYAILSHTWSDEEVLLQDIQKLDFPLASRTGVDSQPCEALGGSKSPKGREKLLSVTDLARRNDYEYLWVDTCCIDKTSSAELSEAINSMYRWYAEADICYAYLADVQPADANDPFKPRSTFRQSRWFRRGWTLQELIASRQVKFFASDWSYLGSKNGDISFTRLLAEITGIQLEVLTGEVSPHDMSLAARMHWAADRQTTRVEDIAYCLLGIFDVTMPLLYGEGKRSFIRLQEAILSREEDQSLFAWHLESLNPSMPGTPQDLTEFSGLLADSPDRFWDHGDLETAMPLALTGDPATITSKGLGVDFLLLPCIDGPSVDKADFRVVLNCERIRNGRRESPVIYLKRIWGLGDQFARVRPDIKTFAPPNISLLEGGFYERIFVKQDPSTDIRMVRVIPAKDRSELQPPSILESIHMATIEWRIKDAWPKQGWTEAAQTFQTHDVTFSLPCGILRLEFTESGKTTTIDVAIGMHSPRERLCRSWCQIMNRDPSLTLEKAFSWAMREAKAGKFSYHDMSTQDIYGTFMSTWVIVAERNRKKGLDIYLRVLSTAPQDVAERQDLASRRETGQIIPVFTLPKQEYNARLLGSSHSAQHSSAKVDWPWHTWRAEVAVLLGDKCVQDSIEISVFPRVPIGSQVRIGSLESIWEYCLNALPAGDAETRRAVQILSGGEGIESQSYLDAARILDGRQDSFLQLLPIHWSVISGNVESFKVLLKSDIGNQEQSVQRRLTVLHLACLLDNPSMLECIATALLATLDGSNGNLNRPIDGPQWSLLRPTINNGDYPLHFAAAYATTPEFWSDSRCLVLTGWNRNDLGESAIHRAAAMGNVAAVKWLLELETGEWHRQSNIMIPDNRGRTPLWHAACTDYDGTITNMLLDASVDPELADEDGLAPVHIACRRDSLGCLRSLKAHKANLNLRAGSLGLLPSHFAAIYGHKSCLNVLLSGDGKPYSYSSDGIVIDALHLAIANGREACARAIWDSRMVKPIFRGWSLCILLQDSGLDIKWMYIEVTRDYWFAIEDPSKEGGTQDFVCHSAKDSKPKLWVRPGIARDIPNAEAEPVDEISLRGNTDSTGEVKDKSDANNEDASHRLGKARHVIRSLFR